MLGFNEIAIIALVVIVLFGTRKLPELGSGLGKAISNFRKSYRDAEVIDVTPKEGETSDQSAEEQNKK